MKKGIKHKIYRIKNNKNNMYYNSYRFSAPTYSIMFIKNRHNEIKIEIIRVKIYSKLVFKTTK